MTEIKLSNLTPQAIEYNVLDIRNRLFPVLRQMDLPRSQPDFPGNPKSSSNYVGD